VRRADLKNARTKKNESWAEITQRGVGAKKTLIKTEFGFQAGKGRENRFSSGFFQRFERRARLRSNSDDSNVHRLEQLQSFEKV